MTVEELNKLNPGEAALVLSRCCGATKWINEMVENRPFQEIESVYDRANKIWFYCFEEDWLEAFTHHPKIGDIASLEKKFTSTKEWAENEQRGIVEATQKTIQKLAELNSDYEDKFGFIFIVCATGKSALEMLDLLETRLENSYEDELLVAMGEQHKITIIRLKKLLS